MGKTNPDNIDVSTYQINLQNQSAHINYSLPQKNDYNKSEPYDYRTPTKWAIDELPGKFRVNVVPDKDLDRKPVVVSQLLNVSRLTSSVEEGEAYKHHPATPLAITVFEEDMSKTRTGIPIDFVGIKQINLRFTPLLNKINNNVPMPINQYKKMDVYHVIDDKGLSRQNNNTSMNHPTFSNNTTVQGIEKTSQEGLLTPVNTSIPLSITTRGRPERGYYYHNMKSITPPENNATIEF